MVIHHYISHRGVSPRKLGDNSESNVCADDPQVIDEKFDCRRRHTIDKELFHHDVNDEMSLRDPGG